MRHAAASIIHREGPSLGVGAGLGICEENFGDDCGMCMMCYGRIRNFESTMDELFVKGGSLYSMVWNMEGCVGDLSARFAAFAAVSDAVTFYNFTSL